MDQVEYSDSVCVGVYLRKTLVACRVRMKGLLSHEMDTCRHRRLVPEESPRVETLPR